jgi:general L-amino acid transport system permease protein
MRLIKWIVQNFFSSLSTSLVSIFIIGLFVYLIPSIFDWAVLDATWYGNSREDCRTNGACWAMVRARLDQFVYGFYPITQRWRVNLSFILLAIGIVNLSILHVRFFYRFIFFSIISVVVLYLLRGGFILKEVPTNLWGGLSLTIFLAFGSMFCSFPIAILLALGRNSSLLVVKGVCVTFIELVRGVPLISILFMASVMLPLFLPQEIVIDKLIRAFVGITLFQASYLAEVLRGGLNSLPTGQREAAISLGMNYWQINCLVILPQVLRVCIPGIVNNFIALFKDTTLVLIIGIYDFLGIVQAATTSPLWLGTALEAYLFCGTVYWIFCFSMSSYSRYLEGKLRTSAHSNEY